MGIAQTLLRLLECPVCLEWMEPPMSQCRRGHLVCGRCRARLAACPVCRTAFSSVRNRAMEAVSVPYVVASRYVLPESGVRLGLTLLSTSFVILLRYRVKIK